VPRRPTSILSLLATALFFAPFCAPFLACAGVSAERGHDQVASIVEQRTGRATHWEKGSPDSAQIAAWVNGLTAHGLTRSRAVEVALVNNPELQATYEELGVSQADMVQAGLLRNPTFGADFGFRLNSGHTDEARLSLVQDFLDLFVMPQRKQIARAQFEADTLRVAHRALEVAAAVEKAFVAAEASVELVAFRRTIVEAAAAADDLSQRQLTAGNLSELDRATGAASYQQAKLELAREEIALMEARESVNRMLGLSGEATAWRFAETLPALPATEVAVDHLEALAMNRRLDVAVARRQVALLAKAVDLARSTRFVGRLEVGVDMHQDPNGPRLLGPNLVIELPIFDQRQAVIARLEAQQRQQERRLAAVAVDTESEVRLAAGRLRTNREMALHYRNVLLPLRSQISEQSLLHYNGMFISVFQLLAAKQAEIDAQRGYIETLRDYWQARAELARAVGGGLPAPPAAPEGNQPHEP
jgi:outer membrane protein, heavy metal efflux system